MADKMKIGFIGTGNIFGAYVDGCKDFDNLDIAAVADLDLDKAHAQADQFDIPRVCTVEELLADPEIELVVNLTIPAVHADVSLLIIEAGKHVHSEKPLAVTLEQGQLVLTAAAKKGVRVGCAPDTFLGGGQQTARKLIDDGWIGEAVAAVAFFMGHGPEAWHPNPGFFYEVGAGPMFDLGPYYVTALINLLGPVRRVTGSTRISFPERIVGSGKDKGKRVPVETPTHVTGVLDFEGGVVATMITSFDVWASQVPRIEVYGSAGSISVPDPNIFGGSVLVKRANAKSWIEMPLTHSDAVGRGIGVADMAYAIRMGRPQRADGDMAYHALEIMHAFDISSTSNQHVELSSRCERPAPLPQIMGQQVMLD